MAAPVGVGGGRESVVGLRRGSQGALPWEAGVVRRVPERVSAPFLGPHSSLPAPHVGRRRLEAPQRAGSGVLVSLCGAVGVIGPICAAPGAPIFFVVSGKTEAASSLEFFFDEYLIPTVFRGYGSPCGLSFRSFCLSQFPWCVLSQIFTLNMFTYYKMLFF